MNQFLITVLSSLALTSSVLGEPGEDTLASYSNYVELRTYVMHPGQRDAFLEHFEAHYLESQEAHGMRIWGQFQDMENDQQFVWIRGYRSMDERAKALLGFYTGQMWQSTSGVVREMMAERATHVHFLEAIDQDSGFPETAEPTGADRPKERGIVVVYLYETEGDGSRTIETIRRSYDPVARANGGVSLGLFRSSRENNNFPALPVIEDENIIAWFLSFPDPDSYHRAQSELDTEQPSFETLVLRPGEFSRLIHRPGEE